MGGWMVGAVEHGRAGCDALATWVPALERGRVCLGGLPEGPGIPEMAARGWGRWGAWLGVGVLLLTSLRGWSPILVGGGPRVPHWVVLPGRGARSPTPTQILYLKGWQDRRRERAGPRSCNYTESICVCVSVHART